VDSHLAAPLAAEGRTVFVSSHLMREMALTADHLIVIGRGWRFADASMHELIRRGSGGWVQVRSPALDRRAGLLPSRDRRRACHPRQLP
jgi:ABC-2 type transport system ATP-binding protein